MGSLFEPFQIKNVQLKNRIVMSPMCMYSCEDEDGKLTPFHYTHYESRAVGQAGLVMVEATAVQPEGRISPQDLGIWSDEHIKGFRILNERLHQHGAKSAIQLAHAGRKSRVKEEIFAPSAIPFDEDSRNPTEMTEDKIQETIQAFREGARRAKEAQFDIIELHGAHGYLIHEFLSPLANQRTDRYGGSKEKRYLFLKEIISAVREEWAGPLFVRISANEYHEDGYDVDDYVTLAHQMKKDGVDLIDCSSGGIVHAQTPIDVYPSYQVPYAETIKNEANLPTGAVGWIRDGNQAEEIIKNNRADLVFIGRAILKNPYWPKQAADDLNVEIESPRQYQRGWMY